MKRKLLAVLGKFDCANKELTARQQGIVRPWLQVFNGTAGGDAFTTQVAQKLAVQLAQIEINPAKQELQVLEGVLSWASLVGSQHILGLLCGEFFPRWHRVLHEWLCGIPEESFEAVAADVVRWYQGWRSFLEEKVGTNCDDSSVVDLGYVRAELGFALDVMLRSREVARPTFATQVPPLSSYSVAIRALQLSDNAAAIATSNEEQQPTSKNARTAPLAHPSSFKTVVAEYAEMTGVTFLPKHGRSHNGNTLYSFGGVLCFITDIVHVEVSKGAWGPISLEDLRLQATK